MTVNENQDHLKNKIRELELQLSESKLELEDTHYQLQNRKEKSRYYQLIADFAFGWELWFEPNGKIKYCSPSCSDLTGYSANQIINSNGINNLIVYTPDQHKFQQFLSRSFEQLLLNQSLEFRILTRTKQLRWCLMNVRGVYDKFGKYLGVRASIQDVTQLKRAMGHIRELEAGKEFENRTKQRLQNEMELKDRELVSFLLQLSQKNELVATVSNKLKNIYKKSSISAQPEINNLLAIIEDKSIEIVDWQVIENQLEKLHPEFFKRLHLKHPKISVKDKKLCAYLLLGLSSKEISGLFNITSKSVEIARVRLRKKMTLSRKENLVNYLSRI